ncbi:MAG: alpha/beta fold hydrolase [Rhodanobacter sp.]
MNAPSELRIALPHLTLAAQTWGDPALPPLLALHGWLDNAGSFALLAPLLANRFHVIALELPGHGHSDHIAPGALYHYVDYARTTLAAAAALKLDHYTLLGHSLGAGTATLMTAAAPQHIDRLFLIEGLGPLGDDGTTTLKRFRDALAPRDGLNKPLRVFRSVDQAISARTIVSGLRGDLARPIIERGVIAVNGGYSWRSDPRLTRATSVRLAETQMHALLRGIDLPVALLLAQPTTAYLPNELMQARAACVAHIHVTHLDGGHHLHLEHPQAVADWINAATAA